MHFFYETKEHSMEIEKRLLSMFLPIFTGHWNVFLLPMVR